MLQKNYFLFIAVGVLTGCALFYFLAPVLMPFFIGVLLAYLINPLVEKLQSWHLPRLLSVIIVFSAALIFFISLVLLLIPLVQEQINILAGTIPNIIIWLQNTVLPWVMSHFNMSMHGESADSIRKVLLENWTKAGGVAGWLIGAVLSSGHVLIAWIMMLVLVPVVTFYLLCDWDGGIQGLRSLLPRALEPVVVKLARECDSVLSAFFRGQLLVMLALGFIYALGLSLVGLQIGVFVGLIAGFMSIVPYLGPIVGILAASIAAYVQTGDFMMVYMVWGIFALGQALESVVLTPYLVGNRIGLHPVMVIFAILVGGTMFGFLGVLLALPVAAVLMVLVRYAVERYRNSLLYRSH